MRSIVCISLLIFFAAGCAIHSPMSEMLMFHEKATMDGETYQARYSHTLLSVTTNIYAEREFLQYANRYYPLNSDESYDYQPPQSVVTHAIFMSDKTDKVVLSLVFGNALGADATAKIAGNSYLTGAVNYTGEPQGLLIVQQRLLDGNPVGLSLGVSVVRNYQIIGVDGNWHCVFCFPSKEFYTTSAGIRTVLTLTHPSPAKTARMFLYATGSMNYDFTMKFFYPRVGIALGWH